MTNWKRLIAVTAGDDQIISSTLTDAESLVEFNNGRGGARGLPFTAWSDRYVYFPVVYDGSEWVGRARRHPCDEKTEHQGGQ